jgi:surface antigen
VQDLTKLFGWRVIMRGVFEPFLAIGLLAATLSSADAQAPGNTVLPALDNPAASHLHYKTGGYFYGDDCGGNAIAIAVPSAQRVSPGVILSGRAGSTLGRVLNCDDRRHALPSYRDAFEGTPGQAYRWRNPNGAVAGEIMSTSRFQNKDRACIGFMAVTNLGQSISTTGGTACREADGNWHMQ